MGLKIWRAFYELKPKFRFGPIAGKAARRGALLKFEFPEIGLGHADCHPWETLGDLSLEEQLLLLKKGQTTPLTQKSLSFAKRDAEARASRISLFESLVLPKNHFLITDYFNCDIPKEWETVKIKLRSDLPAIALKLNKEMKNWNGQIRFDGNNLFTQKEITGFLEKLSPKAKAQIDFFEDPFLFEAESWLETQKKYHISFARDHGAEPFDTGYETVILKPDVQNLEIFKTSPKRKIVTSYLGHPFGQLCAAFEAAHHTTEVCGLLSHLAYEPNAYSEQLVIQESRLLPPSGTGFGFDSLLERENWIPL